MKRRKPVQEGAMLPDGWQKSTVGKSCAIKNNLRLPLNVSQRDAAPGPYPYFGPTGIQGDLDAFDYLPVVAPLP